MEVIGGRRESNVKYILVKKQQTGMVVVAAVASPGKEDQGILGLAGQLV